MKKKKNDDVHENKTVIQNNAGRRKRVVELQSERETKYRTILENIEDGYYEVDLTGNFTFFNNSMCQILGYSQEEMMGMNNRQFTDKENQKKLLKTFNKVYKTAESTKEFDWQIIRKDGTKRFIEVSVSLQKNASGQPTGFQGIARDITDRKKVEEKYRLLADNITEHVWLRDISSLKIIYISPSVEKMYGYPLDEIRNLPLKKLLTEESYQKMVDTFLIEMPKASATLPPSVHKYSLELEARHKNGHLLWIDNTLSFIRDENGKTALILGETRDITKRKQAEEELRESEYKYKSLIENIPDIIFTFDLEGKITFVSKRAKEILGYEDAETINKYLFNFIPEEDRQAAVENLQKGMKGEKIKHIQTPVIATSGEKVFFDCSFTRIYKDGAVVGAQGTAADITERKLAEMALKKSEERYRSVFENAGLPIVIMENSLLIFMVNERFVEMSGYEKERIEGLMKFTDFIASGDRDALLECFSRRKGDKPVEYECQIAHRNGKRFDVLIRLGHIPGVDQFIASFTDITSRKQAEVALLENQEHLQKENIRLRSSIRERYRFCDIIGKSLVMQEVYEFILQAAATLANVIIYGESGTGKELVAKAIHETSDRSRKGFVTVHCGAIPETLMESEFFGYKKGAFTGANVDKRGYLDEADGGTLFLDEVGEIGVNMQVKLLRAISGDGYMPVGSNTIKKTDVRIIAATNRNLRDLVRRGIMREDFFYRIHILPIYLPPLRERKDDLPLLIDYFLQLHDKNHPPLPGNIVEALLSYDWPGNIRELQNVLHRYMTLKRLDFAGGPTTISTRLEGRPPKDGDSILKGIAVRALPSGQAHQFKDHDNMQIEESTMTLEALERDHIMRTLSEHNWHRGRTASALGINRKTLFLKMQKLGLDHS